MVYKKIGSKIPSLSSLLLTGVLLGVAGSCGCGDKQTPASSPEEKQNKATDQNDPQEEKSDSNANAVNDAEQKKDEDLVALPVTDTAIIKGHKELRKILQDALGLSYLTKDRAGAIQPIPKEDLLLPDQSIIGQAINHAKRLSKIDAFCSTDMAAQFEALGQIKSSSVKYAAAFGRALNSLIDIPIRMYAIVEQAYNLIANGAGQAQLNALKKDLVDDQLLKLINELATAKSFSNADNKELLTGPQLARLLTGQEKKKSNTKENLHHVPDKLNKNITCYITTTVSNQGCKLIDTDTNKGNYDFIAQRGFGIKGIPLASKANENIDISSIRPFKVQTGKGTYMIDVPVFDNGKLTSKIDTDKLLTFCKSRDSKEDQLSSSEFLASIQGDEQSSNLSGLSLSNFSYITYLFTLFKGSSDLDFLQVEKADKSELDKVKLIGHDSKFNKWLAISDQDEEFAKTLHDHINKIPELKNLFVIANLQDLLEKFLPSINSSVNDDKPVCILNEKKPLDQIEDLGTGSLLDTLCSAILDSFSLSPNSVEKKLHTTCVANIAKISDCKSIDLESANLTFEQTIALKLAKELVNCASEFFTPPNANLPSRVMSQKELKNKVFTLIEAETHKTIVRIGQNGKIQSTVVTKQIQNLLKDLDACLHSKNKSSAYTYVNLSQLTSSKGVVEPKSSAIGDAKFQISLFQQACKAEANKIGLFLTTKILDILQKEGEVTTEDFPNIPLTTAYLKKMNEQKQLYKERRAKNLNVPAPAT